MARLQGDVNALQDFLENTVAAIGDFVLLFGIIGVLLWMNLKLGLLTLLVLPALIGIRAIWTALLQGHASAAPATPPPSPTAPSPRTSAASAPCRKPAARR